MSNAPALCHAATPIEGRGPGILTKRTTFEVVFSPTGRLLAPLFLLASVFLPPQGLGFDICLLHRLTGLPCPGCGLTRSITSLTHGNFLQAQAYHPFGLIIWLMFVALTLYSLMPASLRTRMASAASRHDPVIRPAYRLFVTSFLAFGVARLALDALAGGGTP